MNMKRTNTILCFMLFLATSAGVAFSQPPPVDPPAAKTEPVESPATEAPAKKSESASESKSIPAAATAKPGDDLSVEQARLADRFKRLEEVVGRLAELSASSDPRRAKLLRDAIAQSREQDISVRFESIVKLLQDERLSAAAKNQTDLQTELDGLLALLLKADRGNELNSQRDRVKKYLQEVSRLIRDQKSIRARTEGGDDLTPLGKDQQRIAADTAKLGGDISKTEGTKKKSGNDKDSKGSSPSDESNGKKSDEPKGGDQGRPSDKKPGDNGDKKANSEDHPGDKSPSDKSPDGKKPNDAKPSQDGKQSQEGRPSKSDKSDDSKPGKSSPSGKPKDGGSPSEGKPSDGQQGKPGESQQSPSQGQQGQQGSQSSGDKEKDDHPPQSKDPADRATEQLKKAREQMEEAQKKLEEAKRDKATERQQEAIKQLEQAKAELERVLRQLREEELERTLTQLAARFRKMLEIQTAIYDGTVRINQVAAAQRTHDHEIESAKLSREETQLVHEVEKALSLLHEEGSSVAFPEAIDQMRDDMRQVAERLAAVKVDKITQGIEQDIIAALEETIAALDKSIKDLEKKRTPPGQQPMAGQPGEMPLVDKLAELKMIRSLQMRINKRTQTYGEMIKGDQAETPELLKSLKDLADRQQRVYRATADLQQKRND